ncbi:MAG: KTSC domain-containing protein [Candidatus Andeanibacterium colombiense]|uniref:KTSC domain-containing protein n=1 Tax=Candidatus Andeanibacterium colombiense TaxID=3121345 RepID=A0AAJ5X8E5_9SPHN|nr:MAG: KTSC domain-containing protein [Sphingomonadaceae bacterium]
MRQPRGTEAGLPRFPGMPSSVIRAYRYDEVRRRLDVDFVSGEVYSYFEVPAEVISGLARARSKGRYFQGNIRDRFDYRRNRKRAPA